MPKKRFLIFLGIVVAICVGVSLLAIVFAPKKTYISYENFQNDVKNGEVATVNLNKSDKMTFTLKSSGTTYITDNPRDLSLKERLLEDGISVTEGENYTIGTAVQMAFGVLFFGALILIIYKTFKKGDGSKTMSLNFCDVTQDGSATVRFKDIAGNREAKESVMDVIDYIKNPEKYNSYGARMPKGILFYGPPGTGKTLMAKAIAGEACVPFFAVNGSDFVQMYVGVGASRIRELFAKAREAGKAVIFIDEIDALGKKRGNAAASNNDERDQTLNALLSEVSGFGESEGIILIAATNRLDTLDEALLRPGRFDRQIEIGLPDINARKEILLQHGKCKPLAGNINMNKLAKETVYFSGAMIENLLNESAILAAKENSESITKSHIDKAYYTILAGSEKLDRSAIAESDKRITAFHEAGHALVSKLMLPENIVSKITIIPSTKGVGGFCVNIPTDKMYYTKNELKAQVMVCLGGRVAEEIIFGSENITTGASNDIEKATNILKDFIAKYGMSDSKAPLNLNLFNEDGKILIECKKIMDELYEKTKILLEKNTVLLNKIAKQLIAVETLDADDLDSICGINKCYNISGDENELNFVEC